MFSHSQVKGYGDTGNYLGSLPPHDKLGMPSLSPTMEDVWKLCAGCETDKAVVGFEVVEDCYLAKILVPEGSSTVNLGEVHPHLYHH